MLPQRVLRAVNASKYVRNRDSTLDPTTGAHNTPTDPLAGFGGGEEEREGKGRKREGERNRGEGREKVEPPHAKILATALQIHLHIVYVVFKLNQGSRY